MKRRNYDFGNSSMSLFLSDIPTVEIFTLRYGRAATQITPHFLYFYGLIDDVRIFSRPLTPREVKKLG